MFDRKSRAQQFRVAVRNFGSNSDYGDSTHKLAVLFRIAPLSPARSTGESRSSNEVESCQGENGIDWSSVLNSWLDACEAAEKVTIADFMNRLDSFINLFIVLLSDSFFARVKQYSAMRAKHYCTQLLINCMHHL
jgi:hypothetical protein